MSDQPIQPVVITPAEPEGCRLDKLAENGIRNVIDRVGEECGIVGLGGHMNGIIHRFVSDNFPADSLTPEAIAERMGIVKPRPNPRKGKR